jgi:protein O-GlcNAc transferase
MSVPEEEKFFQLAQRSHQGSNYTEAWSFCEKALNCSPQHIPSLMLLALLVRDNEDIEKASSFYEKALLLDAENEQILQILGLMYIKESRFFEAQSYLERALTINSEHYPSIYALGLSYFSDKKFRKAIPLLEKYAENFSDKDNLPWLLGQAYYQIGQKPLAIPYLEEFIKKDSSYKCFAHRLLGNCFLSSCHFKKAEDHLFKSLLGEEKDFRMYFDIANLYLTLGKSYKAIDFSRQALKIAPYENCCWQIHLFILNYLENISEKEVFKQHSIGGEKLASMLKNNCEQQITFPKKKSKKLRIGYISPDFKQHSVAYFTIPFLSKHDTQKFNIFCYSSVKDPDNVTKQLESSVANWRDISRFKEGDIEQLIREDRIDILVDLAGHTKGSCTTLMSKRLAPVQVSYLGYPNTTGIKNIDYHITDNFVDPEGADEYYTEELVRLPTSFLCYSPSRLSPRPRLPPSLSKGFITFGCFNTLKKLTRGMVKTWGKLLKELPSSKLYFKDCSLSTQEGRDNFIELFKEYNLGEDRFILFGHFSSHVKHLMAYHEIDIALDTFPYNGTTTTCEALWMGIPVITLKGSAHRSSVTSMLLNEIGHSQWIAENSEEYLEKALSLAKDPEALKNYRSQLRLDLAKSSICDSSRFTMELEQSYQEVWKKFSSR